MRDAHLIRRASERRDLAELDAVERDGRIGALTTKKADRGELESFGGSAAVAGLLGVAALLAVKAGYRNSAYLHARMAAREAIAFVERMDRSQGTPFEIFEPRVFAERFQLVGVTEETSIGIGGQS